MKPRDFTEEVLLVKRWHTFTALLAVFSLLLTLWAPMATAAETAPVTQNYAATDDPLDAPLELLAPLENGDKLCAVYRIIIDGLRNGNEYISFDTQYTLTEEEQEILSSVVRAAIPEVWGNNVGHCYSSLTASHFYTWFYDWGLPTEQYAQLQSKVAEMTADLHGKSDYEKSRILYERVVNTTRYNYGIFDQTAYSALVEGNSVCAGYARAYQMLLQAVGIPCLYLTGMADNGYSVGPHAWNLLRLDGEWYYADVTWDDFDNLYYGLNYTYFNATYDEIGADHFLDAEFELWVPHSTATAANYYVREGLVVETLSLDEMIQLFREHNPLLLRVVGDVDTNSNNITHTFFNYAYDIADALGKGDCTGIEYFSSGNGDYLSLSLSLDHEHNYDWLTLEPTCTSEGSTSYACRDCGDSNSTWLDPLGHDVDEHWTIDTWYHTKYCSRCQGEAEWGEHTYTINGVSCDVCGYSPDADVCTHAYVVTQMVDATCEEAGYIVYTCYLCDGSYTEEILPTGHTRIWEDYDTYHRWYCTACGAQSDPEAHIYLNDTDESCYTCGHIRQVGSGIPGDADGNGTRNNRDLGRLQQFINEWAVTVDFDACDLDGNGKVNNRDLGLLQRLLNE